MELQQQAFRADSAGNHGEFGAIVLHMSRVERSIKNHPGAAAYADEAATAFEQAGDLEGAIAAHSILAREYRTLDSPDLAFASLQAIIRLKRASAGWESDQPTAIPGAEIEPILRLIKSFTACYLSSGLVHYSTEDAQYPAPRLPKGSQRPSEVAAEGLMGDVWRLSTTREATTDDRFDTVFFRAESVCDDLLALRDGAVYRSKPWYGRLGIVLFDL